MRRPCVLAACHARCAGIGVRDSGCGDPCVPIVAAPGGRLVTVKRSLVSENACVLRVRCAAGDDIGISSITLIYAEIVMTSAQTRQDAGRRHFYDDGIRVRGAGVSMRCAGYGEGGTVASPHTICALVAYTTSVAHRWSRSAACDAAGHSLVRPAFDATRSKGRSYNRRHLPLASRLPG